MQSVTDGVGGLTDKLERHRRRRTDRQGSRQGRRGGRRGRVPGQGRAQGRRLRGQGQDHRRRWRGQQPKATKATNIIEEIDVGVPITVAYNQWTQFGEFPSFMKKVENVDAQETRHKINFKAQVFWSHRTWEATILEQVPDERIVWQSKGEKGHVDGAVTFHELGPNLTRILVVLEYYPQGLFERTGNIWRAQGRRARLELKHFRRHVMTRTILEPGRGRGLARHHRGRRGRRRPRGGRRGGGAAERDEEDEEAEGSTSTTRATRTTRTSPRTRRARTRPRTRRASPRTSEDEEDEPEDEEPRRSPRTRTSPRTSRRSEPEEEEPEDEEPEDEYEEEEPSPRRTRSRRGRRGALQRTSPRTRRSPRRSPRTSTRKRRRRRSSRPVARRRAS